MAAVGVIPIRVMAATEDVRLTELGVFEQVSLRHLNWV